MLKMGSKAIIIPIWCVCEESCVLDIKEKKKKMYS